MQESAVARKDNVVEFPVQSPVLELTDDEVIALASLLAVEISFSITGTPEQVRDTTSCYLSAKAKLAEQAKSIVDRRENSASESPNGKA